MQNRYEVVEKTTSDYHPMFPKQTFFYLFDNKTSYLSMGCYTNKETAEKFCAKKNAEVNVFNN